MSGRRQEVVPQRLLLFILPLFIFFLFILLVIHLSSDISLLLPISLVIHLGTLFTFDKSLAIPFLIRSHSNPIFNMSTVVVSVRKQRRVRISKSPSLSRRADENGVDIRWPYRAGLPALRPLPLKVPS